MAQFGLDHGITGCTDHERALRVSVRGEVRIGRDEERIGGNDETMKLHFR